MTSFQTPIVIDEDGFIDLSNKRKRLHSEEYDSDLERQQRMKQKRRIRKIKEKSIQVVDGAVNFKKLPFHVDSQIPYDAIPSDDDKDDNVIIRSNEEKRVRIKKIIKKV